jgi:hypothetical protein
VLAALDHDLVNFNLDTRALARGGLLDQRLEGARPRIDNPVRALETIGLLKGFDFLDKTAAYATVHLGLVAGCRQQALNHHDIGRGVLDLAALASFRAGRCANRGFGSGFLGCGWHVFPGEMN